MKKGLLISFEGIEGCGKTTQATLLVEYLKQKHYAIHYTREPGGTEISDQIRKILLKPENFAMNNLTELLLYLACRAQLVEEVIRPALMQGEIVICDRFIDATIAYQGYGRALSTSLIHTLNQTVTKNLKPNLTFLLDIEPEQGLRNALKKHKDSRGDRLEREEIDFYRRVREGYLEISRFEPERIKVISVNRSIAEVHSIIRKYVDELLEETFGCLYIEQRE